MVYILKAINYSLKNLKQFKLNIKPKSLYTDPKIIDVTDIEIDFFKNYLKVLPKLEDFYLNG